MTLKKLLPNRCGSSPVAVPSTAIGTATDSEQKRPRNGRTANYCHGNATAASHQPLFRVAVVAVTLPRPLRRDSIGGTVRDLDGRRMHTRVRGRQALEKRLRAVLVAVHRFGRCRAAIDADRRWTAHTLDRLTAVLQESASHDQTRRRINDGPRPIGEVPARKSRLERDRPKWRDSADTIDTGCRRASS